MLETPTAVIKRSCSPNDKVHLLLAEGTEIVKTDVGNERAKWHKSNGQSESKQQAPAIKSRQIRS